MLVCTLLAMQVMGSCSLIIDCMLFSSGEMLFLHHSWLEHCIYQYIGLAWSAVKGCTYKILATSLIRGHICKQMKTDEDQLSTVLPLPPKKKSARKYLILSVPKFNAVLKI